MIPVQFQKNALERCRPWPAWGPCVKGKMPKCALQFFQTRGAKAAVRRPAVPPTSTNPPSRSELIL